MKKSRIVIVGASSAIAEQCARLWVANEAVDLVLVGRNPEKIELIAQDLKVRSPDSNISFVVAELTDSDQVSALIKEIASGGTIDLVLVAFGSLPNQRECQNDLVYCHNQLMINGVAVALCAEAFVTQMQRENTGTLAVIGSVAGDRGRQSNYTYGAAKGLVARYLEGLQHRFAGSDVRVVIIKPGPTDTPMTTHLKKDGVKLASAALVAKDIVMGIRKGKTVIYTPAKWYYIMLVVRHIPKLLFNKMRI